MVQKKFAEHYLPEAEVTVVIQAPRPRGQVAWPELRGPIALAVFKLTMSSLVERHFAFEASPLTYINRVSRAYRPAYKAGWSGHISRWPSE